MIVTRDTKSHDNRIKIRYDLASNMMYNQNVVNVLIILKIYVISIVKNN